MTAIIDGTNGITNASWTTSTRPTGVAAGTTGFNTTTASIETYNGNAWNSVGGIYNISALLVAGGGGGAGAGGATTSGAGGGAGGYLPLSVTLAAGTTYSFVIGAGGSAGAASTSDADGFGAK